MSGSSLGFVSVQTSYLQRAPPGVGIVRAVQCAPLQLTSVTQPGRTSMPSVPPPERVHQWIITGTLFTLPCAVTGSGLTLSVAPLSSTQTIGALDSVVPTPVPHGLRSSVPPLELEDAVQNVSATRTMTSRNHRSRMRTSDMGLLLLCVS